MTWIATEGYGSVIRLLQASTTAAGWNRGCCDVPNLCLLETARSARKHWLSSYLDSRWRRELCLSCAYIKWRGKTVSCWKDLASRTGF